MHQNIQDIQFEESWRRVRWILHWEIFNICKGSHGDAVLKHSPPT